MASRHLGRSIGNLDKVRFQLHASYYEIEGVHWDLISQSLVSFRSLKPSSLMPTIKFGTSLCRNFECARVCAKINYLQKMDYVADSKCVQSGFGMNNLNPQSLFYWSGPSFCIMDCQLT